MIPDARSLGITALSRPDLTFLILFIVELWFFYCFLVTDRVLVHNCYKLKIELKTINPNFFMDEISFSSNLIRIYNEISQISIMIGKCGMLFLGHFE